MCWETSHQLYGAVPMCLASSKLLFALYLNFVLYYKPVGHFVHHFALFMNLEGVDFFILLVVVLKISTSLYLFNKILLEQLQIHSDIERSMQEFSCTPAPPLQNGALVTAHKHILR